MKVPSKPLRDHLSSEVTRLSVKFPNLSAALATFQDRGLAKLAEENMDFDAVQSALESMVGDAEELDTDGYMFAIAQQLTSQLDGVARTSLSAGIPVFPELGVALSTTKAEPDNQSGESDAGFRTKLGGKPQWVQSDATPICEHCQKAMTFVAQIDSLANQDTDLGRLLVAKDSFMFADVGMIYVFWCSGCNGTRSILQCG